MNTTDGHGVDLEALGIGIAVAEVPDWRLLYCNRALRGWAAFKDEVLPPIEVVAPGLDRDKALAGLEAGRIVRQEVTMGEAARVRTLEMTVKPWQADNRRLALLEFVDVSSRKRVEMMLDSYSRISERNARELQREKERVEKLLLNVMPRSVYEELRDSGAASPQRVDSASVLMLDFVGFTEMAISREVSALIGELNDIFSSFDRIVEMFGCERIKTIGDGYLAIAGMPTQSPEDAVNVAKVAVRMRRYLERRNASHPSKWLCRIGIATGPLIGSLVGVQKYVYDVFGPTVNMAARLEHLSGPMEISVCDATADLISETFTLEDLGDVCLKGLPPTRAHRLIEELGRRVAA